MTVQRSARVLVVDDEPYIRDSVADYLEDEGHRVRTAASGVEALELLEDEPADVCILDMRMPGVSGAELLRRLTARWPETRVLVLTGSSRFLSGEALASVGLDASHVLAKPVADLAEVAERVARLLAGADRGAGT